MWSPRVQSDRMQFAAKWRLMLEQTPNVDFWQEMVVGLIVKDNRVQGVKTSLGIEILSKSVILTNGTFLNGIIHIGEKQFGGGRAAERAATGITEQLVSLGFESGRMKTGTPPRLDARTIDFSKTEEQKGDVPTTFACTQRAEQQLGWSPRIDLEEGIRRFVAWMQSANPVYFQVGEPWSLGIPIDDS